MEKCDSGLKVVGRSDEERAHLKSSVYKYLLLIALSPASEVNDSDRFWLVKQMCQ